MRKVTAFILTAAMIIGMFPMNAYAKEEGTTNELTVIAEERAVEEILAEEETEEPESIGKAQEEVIAEEAEAGDEEILTETGESDEEPSIENDKATVELLQGTNTYTSLIPTSNDNDSALGSKVVTFNGIKWYIIADGSTGNTQGTVTLFALDPIGTSKFNDDENNNSYAGSRVKGYLDNLTTGSGSFAGVANAIAETDLYDVGVSGAKLFLPSYSDVHGLPDKVRKNHNDRGDYWLRSSGESGWGSLVMYVAGGNGNINTNGDDPDWDMSVRPVLRLELACVNFASNTKTFTVNPNVRVVKITGGANATASGGSTQQTVTGALTAVTYTANQGYYFKAFKDITNNGITVKRTSDTTVTISGTPTANVSITVPDAVHIPAYTSLIPVWSDNAEVLAGKQVSFGGYNWYVIDDNSISKTEGSVTLFAVNSLGRAEFDDRNGINKYSTSVIKRVLDAMTEEGGMLAGVADAIKAVNIVTKGYNSDEIYDTCNNVKLYPPDIETVRTLPGNILNIRDYWWLRSPGVQESGAAAIDLNGNIIENAGVFYNSFLLRPVLQLNLSKVVFADGSKVFIPKSGYSVTLSGGTNATVSGGSTSQTGLTGAMTTVTYTAKDGYYFDVFDDITDRGITVKRTNNTTVTVSGTPTDYVEITVPDAVKKPVARVTTQGGTSTEYDLFEDAVSAWNNAGAGATLTLLTDIETAPIVNVTGGTKESPQIMDLNDHGIVYTGEAISAVTVQDEGCFRLIDSSKAATTRYIITDADGSGIAVSTGKPGSGTYVPVQGGYITGGDDSGVANYGYFEMFSGTIIANVGFVGGGVFNCGDFGGFWHKGGYYA